MHNYSGNSCDEVYRQAATGLLDRGSEQESRTELTKELVHVTFSVENPRKRLVFARPINPAFALVEVLWIMAGRRDVAYLEFWNPRMRDWADEDGHLSGYGHRLRRHFDVDQLKRAVEALQTYNQSRQIVLQIWDSHQDLPDPDPRSPDVPCNVMSHLMLRDGDLEWLQIMRSNDLIWGTPYNFVQFTMLQEILAGWIGCDLGSYNHVSSSLHAYQRHWEHLRQIPQTEPSPNHEMMDCRLSMEEWEELEDELYEIPPRLAEMTTKNIPTLLDEYAHFPEPQQEWVALLVAEALRRNGRTEESRTYIDRAGNYWSQSWKLWANSNDNK